MKKYISFLLVLSYCSSYSQLLFQIRNDSIYSFIYSSGDEFDTDKVNTEYWKGPWNRINMAQNFRYNTENVKISNGIARFEMLKQDSVYPLLGQGVDSAFMREKKLSTLNGTFAVNYSAGMIITRNKYHYGFYELKFKVEEGKGVWPAFWLYGGNKNEEIDIFELKGERNNSVHIDTHCPTGCDHGYKNKIGIGASYGGWLPLNRYLHEGYNTIAIDWRADELIWYVNSYPIAYFKGAFSNPMNVFINTQIAADGKAFSPGPDNNTKFPNNFYVDYFRLWTPISSTLTPTLKASEHTYLTDTSSTNALASPIMKRGLMYSKKKFSDESGTISIILLGKKTLMTSVLGQLSKEAEVYIEGKTVTYIVNKTKANNVVHLEDNEKELVLIVKTKAKVLRKQFTVAD